MRATKGSGKKRRRCRCRGCGRKRGGKEKRRGGAHAGAAPPDTTLGEERDRHLPMSGGGDGFCVG